MEGSLYIKKDLRDITNQNVWILSGLNFKQLKCAYLVTWRNWVVSVTIWLSFMGVHILEIHNEISMNVLWNNLGGDKMGGE